MFLTKKHLSRRTVLKGAGAAIALPLLDAMIPAGTALADTPAVIKPRLGYVYFPHGAVQKFWTPEGSGKDFKFSRILKPLEGMRDYVTVVTNLRNKPAESTDPHGIVEATWLTCLAPTGPRRRARMPACPSTRWPRARSAGDTPLPSLELCGEPGGAVNYQQPGSGPAAGGQPAPRVHDHVRARRFQCRTQGSAAIHGQPARLCAGIQQEPQPHARQFRPRLGE